MPKVAYSEEERARIREALVTTALELMARQGIQHTTVEQVYKAVGISRTFFYSFFPTKEDLIVETLYLQQPRVLAYARKLMAGPGSELAGGGGKVPPRLLLRRAQRHRRFDHRGAAAAFPAACRRRATGSSGRSRPGCSATFWSASASGPATARVSLFTNLCLAVMVIRRAIPDTLPLLGPGGGRRNGWTSRSTPSWTCLETTAGAGHPFQLMAGQSIRPNGTGPALHSDGSLFHQINTKLKNYLYFAVNEPGKPCPVRAACK